MSVSALTASTSLKLSNSRLKIDSSSESYGRGLVTTESFAAGSLLLRLDPLISVLDDALLDKACSACLIPSIAVDEVTGKELLKCTGCGFLRYCSKVTPILNLC